MLTPNQVRTAINSGSVINIAVVGDSTTAGFGANPAPNLWTNGLSYGCVNLPAFGPNWQVGQPYSIVTTTYPTQPQQDNVLIPSAVRLLRTYIEGLNAASKVYNFGIAGAAADTHISAGTIALVAAKTPKPDVVFINLGINSAKNNLDQTSDLQTLVNQTVAADMLPVIVIAHNIGVAYTPSGNWVDASTPDQWYPMDNWQTVRNAMKSLASTNGLEYIDLGTDAGTLDITGLYDSFHPSNIGYSRIFDLYKDWTLIPDIPLFTGIPSGSGSIRVKGLSKSVTSSIGSSVKFDGSVEEFARLKLNESSSLRIRSLTASKP